MLSLKKKRVHTIHLGSQFTNHQQDLSAFNVFMNRNDGFKSSTTMGRLLSLSWNTTYLH